MIKKNSMKHRRDVLSMRIEDLNEAIFPKEQLMRDRGHGDLIEGQWNHKSLFTNQHWDTYGCKSLRDLYARRRALMAKLKKCDEYFIQKEHSYNKMEMQVQ